jgi:hypothetical protein
MSRAHRGQAYSVSLIMSMVRMEQVRARDRLRPAQPVDRRRTLAFIACAAAMFAIFFAVGRATSGTHASSSAATYSPSQLTSASVHAGIPYGVVTAPPLPASNTFRAPPPPPTHASPAHHTAAAAAPVAVAPVASAPVASAPAATPAPAAPVTPAPVQHTSAPAPSQPSSEPSGGGGGSFDSSE